MKTDFFVEFNGKKVNQKQLEDKAKELWKSEGNKVKDLKTVELYYKPDENKCYYVFNGKSGESNCFDV